MRSSRYGLNQQKCLSEEEWKRLEQVCKRELASPRERDALLLLLALRTGARATELLGLVRNDFFERERKILITGIKGSNDREIPLEDYLARALASYLRRMDGDVIFPITYWRLRQIWDWYRPVEKTFHSLRHTFGLNVYLATRDIHLTQKALGHRSIQNTMIYVDYAYSMREMRKIIF